MLRTPLRTLYSKTVQSTITGSDTFSLPFSDFDGLVAKVVVGSLTGNPASLNIYIQTTDDGGGTYYDCVSFGTLSSTLANANAYFATIPVAPGDGYFISGITQSAGANSVTHLPLLSNQVKVVWDYATMTSTSQANWTLTLTANNQSSYS